MQAQSNLPLPTEPQRWKEGEFIIYNNHIDNGVMPDEEGGMRYMADFTIIKELTIDAVIQAFTRMLYEPTLEQKVVDTIEVAGGKAIDVVSVYPTKVFPTIFPALPSFGTLKKGQVFSYNNGAVMVVQDHTRTVYAPELTPALFSFYRTITEGQEWIAGEQVTVNATRTYNGKTYKCIQSHQTQSDWTPDVASTLWKVYEETGSDIPVWKQPTGAHDAYQIGDQVLYNGNTYESKINANTTNPVGDIPYNRYWIPV